MAEEAERVGGISVGVEGDDSRLEADLAQSLAKIEAWAKAASQAATVHISAAFQGVQRIANQQPPSIKFGKGGLGGASSSEYAALERAISAATSKEEQALGKVADSASKARTSARQDFIVDVKAVAAEPVEVRLDTSDAQGLLDHLIASLRELREMAAQPIEVKVTGAANAGEKIAGRGGGGKRQAAQGQNDEDPDAGKRRKNLKDRAIGTEVSPDYIYTFDAAQYEQEERASEAKAARAREQAAQDHRKSRERLDKEADASFIRSLAPVNERELAARRLDALPEPKNAPPQVSPSTTILTGGGASGSAFARDQSAVTASNRRQQSPEEQAAARRRQQQQAAQRRRQAERAALQPTLDDLDAGADAAVKEALRGRTLNEFQRERRIEGIVERQRAGITGGGQTSRTFTAGLGALFGGTRGESIEARAKQASAERELSAAERQALPIRRQLADFDDRIANTSRASSRAAIQRRRDIFANSAEVRTVLKREEDAITGLAEADKRLSKLQGLPSIARNLVAITASGAAFGAGLKLVDVAISAITPAVEDLIDRQAGFAALTTRVTSGLAQQTIALHGNVDAVLAAQAAQAGLSSASLDAVSSQVKLTTQVKAGALAQQQASDLFRASAGIGQTPQGLFGGFGGVFNSGFLAQQLGGGKGFQETVAGDVGALSGQKPGKSPLDDIGQGLQFLTNGDFRKFITDQGKQQNQPIVNPFQGTPIGAATDLVGMLLNGGPQPTAQPVQPKLPGQDLSGTGLQLVTGYLDDLNEAAKRGATALGTTTRVEYGRVSTEEELARATAVAAQAGDQYGVTLAQSAGIIVRVNGEVARSAEDYKRAVEQAAIGKSLPDPRTLGQLALAQERQRQVESRASVEAIKARQEFERPSIIAQANREQQFSLNTQLPAEAALQNLAQPLATPGSSIVAANAKEQKKILEYTKDTKTVQGELNAYYKQGENILRDTYQVPDTLINSLRGVGRQITDIQVGLGKEQAAYAVAQYNFQLQIAKRSLQDINGLTNRNFGGVGQSYLGDLEKQNLALSRQGQLLAFNLQQRQINYQVALAGFEAPGVTPEERQANVKAAETEASFAQKQLNIQKQLFGNQVKIVDIQNLRQGADLAHQISLLTQGRQVTIDTQLAQEKLAALQRKQQQLVAEVGTYLAKTNKLASAAMSEIAQLEAAAGQALDRATQQSVYALYGYFAAATKAWNTAFQSQQYAPPPSQRDTHDASGKPNAAGAVFSASSAQTMTFGEAGTETVAILRNPRNVNMMSDGGTGTGDVHIEFSGDIYTQDKNDLQQITRAVIQALGKGAAIRGLRQIG